MPQWNNDEFEKLLKRRPNLLVGGLQKPEQKQGGALDATAPTGQGGKERVVCGGNAGKPQYRITIISFRRKLIEDSDNFSVGFKPLRDAIAKTLGIDDRDLGLCPSPDKGKTGDRGSD